VPNNTIRSTVSSGTESFGPGDEDKLEEHLATLDDDVRERSVAHLAKSGAIEGFGADDERIEADPTLQARKGMGENSYEGEEDNVERTFVDADGTSTTTGGDPEVIGERATAAGESESARPRRRRGRK
jgi:hypothetical protein